MKVVYGHTDSIYVEMPMNRAEETLALLNNHVRGLFPNLLGLKEHPVTLEFEKYYESLGVGITKNRNAGLISWKDGVTLDEPEFVMTGFAAKRVAITQLAKDIQLTVLKMWVEQKSEQEITNYLKTEYNKVLNGEIDIKNITNRSRFKPERVRYKCNYCSKEYDIDDVLKIRREFTQNAFCSKCGKDLLLKTMMGKDPSIGGGIEGVIWWNQVYGVPIEDSYVYVRVSDDPSRPTYINPITGVSKRPTYLAASSLVDLNKHCNFQPDWRHYALSVIKKAEPIYMAMGWDTKPISQDINQTNLNEWW
jgi:DNA-directed RNA polymerase subunit RPC12/RpoP